MHERSNSDGTTLEPLAPKKAVTMYLDSRHEVSESTLRSHEYRLARFLEWCEEVGIKNTNHLSGRSLHEFKIWRRDHGNVNRVTLQTQLSTLRVFLKFCESIDAVQSDLSEKLMLPTLKDGEGERTETLKENRADEILEYLRKFEYASFDHALLELLWHCGMRIGEIRALDVSDFHPRNQRLAVEHRPQGGASAGGPMKVGPEGNRITETTSDRKGGTPLKNGKNGERLVSLKESVCDVLSDYIDSRRHDMTDGYGRDPLFTSGQGRVSTSTLRRTVYRVTQPCLVGECPLDRDPNECEDRGYSSTKCPSALRPHDVRRGAITHFLSEDVPEKVVGDRMDVSSKVLDAHYDQRSKEQKMEQRRQYLDNI